ncbi:ABC transporter substrate-binding protein [Brachybacterium sp. YJGR34]|uniref:transporter substrate-binding domain-containing protein n=1 Tax=Brachybacterium sp. YJGR34 TaxID=2059911 RepID=UPI000E0AB79D|nr:ABC transporter substrate-binding protein [Brachybacterium sp. YJGR34]
MSPSTSRRGVLVLAGSLIALGVTGCGAGIPRDAQGTLRRATGGTLRVGASQNPPWVDITADGAVDGSEAELIEGFAATIDARIEWIPGAESVLARTMEDDGLDVIIGGLTSDTPFSAQISPTRPYATVQAPDGSTLKRVLGVRPGENALQVALERYLARASGDL